ncbi:L,D-transpeptidase [Methylopila jiangsuensis]|uniref:L,D-transpeptidase n=1 Tax=Methylopila jiangsuensis TaxID=586230 RepID=A0A9W6N555_9HYPH|nr:L,D-transpeptidase [Methylopila jiangsuensis]MDR6284718.1 lipoprotein-anchoring transpeptidase ErfK/SrfK [Methylopila jiangsuensis]GLK77892.1 L,D-transpeptidase [Methylopila jiangsuensis]
MFKRALAFAAVALGLAAAAPAEATVVAQISLSKQRMDVVVNGARAYSWPVSTARRGYVTPTGSYRPTRTARMWHSRKYDMSPMPYSVFFRGGYAIHGTSYVRSLGRPASHGCVRLHTANAAILYNLVQQKGFGAARVVIRP